MSTMSRIVLSGTPADGQGIKVGATSIGSGTTIHTAASGIDEVDIYVANNDTVSYDLTLGWGGTSSIDDTIIVTVPAKSFIPVVLKLPIGNSKVVKAACNVTNKLSLFGGATRIA